MKILGFPWWVVAGVGAIVGAVWYSDRVLLAQSPVASRLTPGGNPVDQSLPVTFDAFIDMTAMRVQAGANAQSSTTSPLLLVAGWKLQQAASLFNTWGYPVTGALFAQWATLDPNGSFPSNASLRYTTPTPDGRGYLVDANMPTFQDNAVNTHMRKPFSLPDEGDFQIMMGRVVTLKGYGYPAAANLYAIRAAFDHGALVDLTLG